MIRPSSPAAAGRPAADARVVLTGETLVAGHAVAPVLAIEPLSFWGGYDSVRGEIIDPRHPSCGAHLAGTIVAMPRAKGSSSSSSVLAEAIRNGTGPAGIVLRERDLIVSIGTIVASELYRIQVPLVVVGEREFAYLCATPGHVEIDAPDGAERARIVLHDAAGTPPPSTARAPEPSGRTIGNE